MNDILLGVNIDHIATLRNARGTSRDAAARVGQRALDGVTDRERARALEP